MALTAAATVIEPDDQVQVGRIRRGAEPWQRTGWDNYDNLAEIAFAANYQSGALSRIRVGPAVQEDPSEAPQLLDPEGDDDLDVEQPIRDAMFATAHRLGSGEQSLSELQRLIALNLFIAGDGYLVGYEDKGEETWDFLSVEELIVSQDGRGYARRTPGYGLGQESLPDDAFICRIFQRHPRFSKWAYSNMKSIIGLCDELTVLSDAIRATAVSRIPAGILALSRNFLAGPNDQTLTGQRDEAANDPVVQSYIEHFETPIKNRRSAAAAMPFLLFGETQDIKDGIHAIEFNRQIDKVYGDQRNEIIARIAIGLDLPPEILKGIGDVTHWNAWAVDEQTFKYHLEPDAIVMVNALTTGYFRPHLDKMGIEGTQRYCLWYDPAPLVAHPNQSADYLALYKEMEVSGEALRRVTNVPETDAPSDEERARRQWTEMLGRARVTLKDLPSPDEIEAGDIKVEPPTDPATPDPAPAPLAPASDAPPIASPVTNETTPRGPAQTAPPTQAKPPPARAGASVTVPSLKALTASAAIAPLGTRLAGLERTLRLRLQSEADAAMARTLERAGNRLRGLASRAGLGLKADVSKLDALEVAAFLGPDKVAELATSTHDVLTAAFVGNRLQAKWNTLVGRTQEQALAAIAEHGDLSDEEIATIQGDQGRLREDGWGILSAGLLTLGAKLLYDPDAPPPTQGEWSDFTVPTGIIRDALSTAGGGPADGMPSAGLLDGDTIDGALSSAGLDVTGYVWSWGGADRPFEPHADLDGTEFTSFDDEALANPSDWPPVDYFYVGDHDGCSCSVELSIVSGANVDGGDESE